MDTVLFIAGGTPITLGLALMAGCILLFLVACGVLIQTIRANARQSVAAAEAYTQRLRESFDERLAERDARIQDLDAQLYRQREANSDLMAEAAGLKARMGEQTRQYELSLKRFEGARQQMTDEFKAVAGDILKSQSETFSRQNREQVDVLLKPLREKIVEFQTGMVADRSAMREQIRALAESNLQITTEANNLTRALKGNSQTQGAWGEMILSSILERSGLREGEQYLTQQTHSGDDRARLRTDIEILMPNADRIVIDSKVSLTGFEAYVNCEDEEERARHLQAHLTSIRTHIKTLGEKDYHRHARSSLDYVLMFVPIESALSAAVNADSSLFEYAMGRGVMLTTPTTLMTILRTVRNIWDIEKRHQNAEEIAERAGSLYDKVVGFVGNLDKLGTHLDRAQQSFGEAKTQLTSGRGNVMRQVEMLRELGAKTGKQMPSGWESSEVEPRSIGQRETGMLNFDEEETAPQRLAGE
ncbi:DNA recombination protein RmuC [Devosia pacifica]|uniref:DNA recombination protein RmuC homolog n=1 Tax=Devosia pacifica TaxID=1335967 RepID=A0A918SB06_9HYPH|nr:DNA recombination protein RmuC [Devosia pacifica]GHA31805.1 DNA recombination protein RmuC [Devosia pacifica]